MSDGFLPGEPQGSMVNGAYLARPMDPPEGFEVARDSKVVVLLTDAFGLPLVNCKIIADNLAKRLDCRVWVPDIFQGEPLFPVNAFKGIWPERAGERISISGYLRLTGKAIPRIPLLIRQRPSAVNRRIESFIKKLKEENEHVRIALVGYSFGASAAIQLGQSPLVNKIVLCHPGKCTIKQIKAINVPASWACSEDDILFSPKIRREAEEAFKSRQDKIEYEFYDYKGTAHGFAIQPDLSIPDVKAGYEGAFEQTVSWLRTVYWVTFSITASDSSEAHVSSTKIDWRAQFCLFWEVSRLLV